MVQTSTSFWEEAYTRNINKMIGICLRYTGDRPLAEDLAHDAFLKAIEKSAGFEGRGSFDGWLRRIVVNHTLQYIRDQRKHALSDEALSTEDNLADEDAPSAGYPEFSDQELLDAIQRLPEHHKLVFNLYVIDNFTHVKIGDALGISAGTSKSHLARARKKLKQLLAQKAEENRRDKKRIPFLLWPFGASRIDRLFREQFVEFKVSVDKLSLPDVSHAPVVNLTQQGMAYFTVAASVGGIILATVIFYNYQRLAKLPGGTEVAKAALIPDKNVAPLSDSTDVKPIETKSAKNTSSVKNSTPATFSKTSVIGKTMNQKHMKNLDSLAALLLVSSSVVFDSAAQSSLNVVSNSNDKQLVLNGANTVSVNDANISSLPDKDKHESGTFYGQTLFWSEKNNELYFKGKSVVHIGRNNFVTDGSANFLGPVFLLIINGEEIKLGATIKLTDKKYHLARLTNKEAEKKYGDKGVNGAVEILEE